MKKFYFLMCMTALLGLLTVSCKKDNGGNGGNGDGSKLAAPVITEENIEILSTTSAKVKWEAVPNADRYAFMVGTEFTYAEKEATEIVLEKLKLGENVIKVKTIAAPNSGYIDSDFASFTIVIESDYTPEMDEYIGTWEITPTNLLQYDLYGETPSDAVLTPNNEPITVYIAPSQVELPLQDGSKLPTLWVLGITQYDPDQDKDTPDSQNIASYNFFTNEFDGDGNMTKEYHQLEILANMFYTDPDEEGYQLTTLPLCKMNNDLQDIKIVTGVLPAISIRLMDKEGAAQFQFFTGSTTGGDTFEVIALEHFLFNQKDGYFGGWEYTYYYAGPFTGKRVSTEVPFGAAFRKYNTDKLAKGQVIANVKSALASSKPSVLVGQIAL